MAATDEENKKSPGSKQKLRRLSDPLKIKSADFVAANQRRSASLGGEGLSNVTQILTQLELERFENLQKLHGTAMEEDEADEIVDKGSITVKYSSGLNVTKEALVPIFINSGSPIVSGKGQRKILKPIPLVFDDTSPTLSRSPSPQHPDWIMPTLAEDSEIEVNSPKLANLNSAETHIQTGARKISVDLFCSPKTDGSAEHEQPKRHSVTFPIQGYKPGLLKHKGNLDGSPKHDFIEKPKEEVVETASAKAEEDNKKQATENDTTAKVTKDKSKDGETGEETLNGNSSKVRFNENGVAADKKEGKSGSKGSKGNSKVLRRKNTPARLPKVQRLQAKNRLPAQDALDEEAEEGEEVKDTGSPGVKEPDLKEAAEILEEEEEEENCPTEDSTNQMKDHDQTIQETDGETSVDKTTELDIKQEGNT